MRTPVVLVALTCLVALTAGCATSSSPDNSPGRQTQSLALTGPTAAIRVDLVGYLSGERKVAHLMAPVRPSPPSFTVVSTNGQVVLTGQAEASSGPWNERYPAVFPLDLSALRTPGKYHVEVPTLQVRSAEFRVGPAAELLRPAIEAAATSFRAQQDADQDKANAPSARHGSDARANEYAWPHFASADSDIITDPTLRRTAGPLDVAGGWADNGGTVKLTSTTAYTTTLLLAAERDLGTAAPAALRTQGAVGLDWLRKAWQASPGRVAVQVGIVRGDAGQTFLGDRGLWRLPERDDALTGAKLRYLAQRPVFTTDARSGRLSPALAGRMAAAFALSAQLQASKDPEQARADLKLAIEIFDKARTDRVGEQELLVSAPRSLAPDVSWRDDLELGAAELARTAVSLQDPSAGRWARTASRWAQEYIDQEADAGHAFSQGDVSALAHAELAAALDASPSTGRSTRTRERVLADLERQLDLGEAQSRRDPFGAGASPAKPDVAARTFGLIASARLWKALTGDTKYDGFASAQRQWAFGANPWGVSLMIGVGSTSPQCPHHLTANLTGVQTLRGAIVNGPVGADAAGSGLGDYPVNSRICPPGGGHQYAPFDGQSSTFADDVRALQNVEPSISRTALGAFALALNTAVDAQDGSLAAVSPNVASRRSTTSSSQSN